MTTTPSDPKHSIHSSLQDSYGPETAPAHYQHSDGPQTVSYPDHSYPQALPAQDHYYQSERLNHTEQQPPGISKRRKILGLPVIWFWVLVAAVALALCVALGVGLGIGLSQRSSSSSSADSGSDSTQTTSSVPSPSEDVASGDATQSAPVSSGLPTSEPAPTESLATSAEPTRGSSTDSSPASATSSAPVTSGTIGLSDNSCTSTTPRTYVSKEGKPFLQYCFTDWPKGGDAADGSGEVLDVSRTITYTFEDCMEACLSYNKRTSSSQMKCGAVTYNSNLTSIIAEGQQGGNCFFKNKKGVDHLGRAESACAVLVA
ncbi:hypothetical protein ACHAQH_006065 [Verticillium albo-atrum]